MPRRAANKRTISSSGYTADGGSIGFRRRPPIAHVMDGGRTNALWSMVKTARITTAMNTDRRPYN